MPVTHWQRSTAPPCPVVALLAVYSDGPQGGPDGAHDGPALATTYIRIWVPDTAEDAARTCIMLNCSEQTASWSQSVHRSHAIKTATGFFMELP